MGDALEQSLRRDGTAGSPSLAAAHRGAFRAGGFFVVLLVLALIPGQSWGQLGFGLLLYAGYALAVVLAPASADAEPTEDPST